MQVIQIKSILSSLIFWCDYYSYTKCSLKWAALTSARIKLIVEFTCDIFFINIKKETIL